jgi:hypothetical protein
LETGRPDDARAFFLDALAYDDTGQRVLPG